ncbi:MAG: glycolate oxidase subunit GlcF [Novosphingobium sp.]
MRTSFTSEQLADPATAESEAIIRKCVHCGFCTATCPTYTLLGDELDSPRGRIYLLKEMLENAAEPTPQVVRHIDRCLSCLSCTTTCPSGVDYMHLIDHGRAYIESNYRRPLADRLIRRMLAGILPYPRRMRVALGLGGLARPLAPLFARIPGMAPIAAMLRMAPDSLPAAASPPVRTGRPASVKGRVIVFGGCVEPVLRPSFGAALKRVVERCGVDWVEAQGEGCCGALAHHLGRTGESVEAARRNVRAWQAELARGPVLGIVTTASGCGTMLKDYGHLLQDDPELAETAREIAALICDSSELLSRLDLPPAVPSSLTVAYHAACSLQHGQKLGPLPKRLLEQCGYTVRTPAEAHLCCGSAGTYNLLQPEIAGKLGDRKVGHLEALRPDVIATSNIGCATQIAARSGVPVVHVVELVDWATGGPAPAPFQLDRKHMA